MIKLFGSNLAKSLLFGLVAALILSACTGGGGKPAAGTPAAGTPAAPAAAPTITLSLTNAAGTPVTSISSAAPTIVKAVVRDAAGVAVPNSVVTFTTSATLVTMNPVNGTALTDATGLASIQISPANIAAAGATTITASAQVAATAVTATTGFAIGATAVTISAPAFGTGVAALSANGTTSVSVTVSIAGVPATTPQTVNFSSSCASSGKAILSSGIATVNGVATASYQDKGCAGTDTVTATVGTGLASSSSVLTVTAPAVGALQYVSAVPTNIALKGSGGAPTSAVTFKVVDAGNNPISGKTVTFGLSTTVGGLALAAPNGISDALGLVVATVNAGTVSTPVRVTASTPGATAGVTLTTQSSQLSITTGIPDSSGFTLAVATHATESWGTDGVLSVMTARLSDHFKNPAPDGTTVNFTTEAGSVLATCNTVGGVCTSTWTSQGTRPANGRTTVLAYAVGEETFTDLNGNGLADLAPVNEMTDVNGASTDLAEAYVDYNENGIRDAATEPFIDFNADGVFQAVGDAKYNGVLCDNTVAPPVGSSAGTCAVAKTLHVRSPNIIVFSTSTPDVVTWPVPVTGVAPNQVHALPPCTAAGPGAPETFQITIVDQHGNSMPAGTTVSVTTTNGTIIAGGTSTIGDSAGCRTGFAGCPASVGTATFGDIPVVMKSDATWAAGVCTNQSAVGTLTVRVTTPKQVITDLLTPITD